MLTAEEKERVFQSTRRLFSERPVEQIHMKDVAAVSGVDTKRLVDEYKTPQELLKNIITQGIDESTNLFIRMVDARGKADIKLIRLVRDLLNQYEKHAPLFRLVSFNFITVDQIGLGIKHSLSTKEIERYRQNTAIIGRIIAQGQSEGIFVKDVDPLEAAYILRGMIQAVIQYWQLVRKDEPLHKHADFITRVFLKGVYK